MSSIADIFSGGADSDAASALDKAYSIYDGVSTPTAQQLTLPPLQQYVQAGVLTPEQAQTYLDSTNAFSTASADNTGMDSELSAIGQLQNIVNSGGNDAGEQADMASILNTLGTTEHGDNAAIVANNARQGISNSGLTMAAQLAEDQNDATNANSNAVNANAAAEARNMAALTAEGTLGGNVQGQQYTQTANAANAADAIAQFNATQKQNEENINTTAKNQAQAANLANAQTVSNANVATNQTQEESIPAAQQQAYEDALQKAGGQTGIAEAQANQQTQVGQQNAGILGGLISAAGTVGSAYLTDGASLAGSSGGNNTSTTTNNGQEVSTGGRITPHGVERPINMKSGGPVPGQAVVPGDSSMNDTQLAALSPDEVVLPRTAAIPAMRGDPSKALQFLRSLPRPQAKPSIHPRAVLDTMRALSAHHQGVPA